MNKNVRRTLVIAAGVSGAWALGSAVASADEQPAHSLSVPDATADVTDAVTDTGAEVTGVTDTAHGTVDRAAATVQTTHQSARGAVRAVVSSAAGTAQSTVSGAGDGANGALAQVPGAAQDALSHAAGTAAQSGNAAYRALAHTRDAPDAAVQGTGGAAHAAVHHAEQTADGAGADAGRRVQGAAAGAEQSVGVTASAAGADAEQARGAAQEEVDYLFGPLSAFAPDLAAEAAQTAQAPVDVSGTPAQVRTLGQALGDGAGHALRQLPGQGQQAYAVPAAAGTPVGVSGPAEAGAVAAGATQAVTVVLRVVGDAMYAGQGVLGSVTAGEVPSTELAVSDTERLVERAVSGVSEVVGMQTPQR